MDADNARIVGDRRLPCHGRRAARLAVADGPVTRTCAICGRKYSITFVAAPHLSERLQMPVYRTEIVPFVDARTLRRRARDEGEPTLPFGDADSAISI